MNRPKFSTKQIILIGEMQRNTAISVIQNAPIDPIAPLEVVIREQVRVRSLDANSLMWVGPLKDIAEQAWVNGKRYSDVVWHEHFKREYLPEEYEEGITKEGYVKWDIDPAGNKVLIGSTTQLTKRGFSIYLEQIHAYGANLGVMFTELGNG